ncbi:MAG: hypothetical protein IT536_10685 [Hyphomicrobiales bacterium]|nr:hypothetical protein [Hyphomicrobiales bacterium]
MESPAFRDHASQSPAPAVRAPIHYAIEQRLERWYIRFEGADYGPYLSEREALLFAVEAANKLGGQGAATQVLLTDQNGHCRPVWTFGQDPYPPRL